MNAAGYRLTDILDDTYSDFFEYCRIAKKEYSSELTSSDYIAFRTKYAKTREYINSLRTKIESYVSAVQENESEEETDEVIGLDLDYGFGDFFTYGDYVEKEKSIEPAESEVESEGELCENDELIQNQEENEKKTKKKSKQERIDNTITNYDKSDRNSAFLAWEQSETLSIAKILDVDNNDVYVDIPTVLIGLSVRAGNVLRNAGIDNMAKVLDLSYEKMMGLKNAGRTTAKNVFEEAFRIINDSSVLGDIRKTVRIKGSPKSSLTAIRSAEALRAYLKGEEYDLTNLSEAASEEYNTRLLLTEELRDITLFALENPEYTAVVINGLFEFFSGCDRSKAKEKEIYECVNERTKYLKLLPCYKVYSVQVKAQSFYLEDIDLENATINDLAESVAKNVDRYSEEEFLHIKRFLKWVDFDINAACRYIFGFVDEKNNGRLTDILNGRLAKRTLEEIAGDYGITRERVRQMESKALRNIRRRIHDYKVNHGHDIWDMIYMLSGGKSVIRLDTIEALTDKQYASWLWYEMQMRENGSYRKEFNAVFMNGDIPEEITAEFFAWMPDIIEKDKARELTNSFAAEHNVDKEVLWLNFIGAYTKIGVFYSCVRITTSRACSYILKHRFPQGFKIGNEDERRRFDRYTAELFEEKYVYATQHALDSAVSKVGVLCDRGKYIHPDYVNIDESIFDEIKEYIENSPNKAVTYSEIYNALESRFIGTQITNRFMLQGFIGMHSIPYALTRDYVQKEKDANVLGEIERFIRDNSPVHKNDIIDRFPFVNELYLSGLNMKNRDILYIGGGYYFHSSRIIITDEEKASIRAQLLKRCNTDHVNVRALINDFYDLYPDFMMNNEIEDHHKLFALLRYLCDDILNFDKPYISLEKDKRITNYGVLREKIGNRTEITISEIFDLCQDMGMAEGGMTGAIRGLFPEFIRVNEDSIMLTELTGVDQEIIEEVVNFINSKVNASGYCASRSFTDLIWLSEINVPWNTFLIESVAELSDDMVNILRPKSGSIHYTQDVYVSDKYAGYDFETFVLELLKTRHNEYPFKTKTEIINWLKEEGLSHSNNMPKYLQNSIRFDGGNIVIG